MWFFEGKEFTSKLAQRFISEGAEGFVYIITDKSNGKKYIGKKGLVSRRKLPPLKGQKRRRTKVSESDWQKYFGSSTEVQSLVKSLGPENFHREVIRICYSKGEMTYWEMYEQMLNHVLLKPDEYYNAFVGGKIHRNHVLKK